ncbi:hypothetical protein CEXT_750081 [Caerostris extrusa]|uniref:Uncharacterized protein n=1 Tax=Caerostris extrusa TaxID=172846 RepID=A0AAV4QNR8_CAEEX|nr:hypothetical protein CEXT_750081 [Caerostris extrusa]
MGALVLRFVSCLTLSTLSPASLSPVRFPQRYSRGNSFQHSFKRPLAFGSDHKVLQLGFSKGPCNDAVRNHSQFSALSAKATVPHDDVPAGPDLGGGSIGASETRPSTGLKHVVKLLSDVRGDGL